MTHLLAVLLPTTQQFVLTLELRQVLYRLCESDRIVFEVAKTEIALFAKYATYQSRLMAMIDYLYVKRIPANIAMSNPFQVLNRIRCDLVSPTRYDFRAPKAQFTLLAPLATFSFVKLPRFLVFVTGATPHLLIISS